MFDVYEIRKHFPMLNGKKMQGKDLVFLDNASTTFKPFEVISAIDSYYLKSTSNSHRGDYDLAYSMDLEVDKTRSVVADFIGCKPEEVVFTSGDSMSLNIVAFSYGMKFLNKDDEILVSISEHASNLLPWFRVCEIKGCKIKYIPLDEEGKITPDNLKKVISKNTKVVSIAHVGNVLGFTINIKEICKICHDFGAICVVDGAQSVPHMRVNFKEFDIDFLGFSGHKMCGPTGIGVLVGKYYLLDKMDPFLNGGGMNSKFYETGKIEYLKPPIKFEAGTLHLAGIIGLKAAIEFLGKIGMDKIKEHESMLKKHFLDRASNISNLIVYNKNSDSGIVTFNVKGNFAQDEATLLNSKGIAVRSGQHCAKILNSFLKTPATVRASFYFYTTIEEVDRLLDELENGGDVLDAYFN